MTWQHSDRFSFINSKTLPANKSALLMLDSYGALRVEGEDASIFLHNLLSCDVRSLTDYASSLSGLCNPKGRLLAILTVIKLPDGFLLILPANQCSFIQQRLSMFVLRSKVHIRQQPDYYLFALLNCAADLSALQTPIVLTSLPYLSNCQLGIIESSQANSLLTLANEQHWQIGADNLWQQQLIEAGIAEVYTDSREAFTPQQVNLDLVGGINFNKGCYPGQEVVARMHYLGKPGRRLFKAQLQDKVTPSVNTKVVNADNEVAGHVVIAAQQDNNLQLLQLSIKLAETDKPLFINNHPVVGLLAYDDAIS